ncbi:hypothetical protein [Xenorhabdus doucetiae]|nr:hypothetical protein [Xenorhabdus sp. 3]
MHKAGENFQQIVRQQYLILEQLIRDCGSAYGAALKESCSIALVRVI